MSFSINFSQVSPSVCKLDIHETAKNFCNIYYSNTVQGISNVLPLFDSNVHCNYCGKEFSGMYNVMVLMASDGIARMQYDKLSGTIIPINNESISVQIIGLCQGVTFWNVATAIKTFSETFILTLCGDKIMVTSYCFRLI
jgi:hypothetical protein